MKLKFKHQKFQADASRAVCDVFAGQPWHTPSYMMDKGFVENEHPTFDEAERFTGFGNSRIAPELNDRVILENINKIQHSSQIEPSRELAGRYNLTIEMETGERVIIVTGCINAFKSRVSEIFIKNNSCIA